MVGVRKIRKCWSWSDLCRSRHGWPLTPMIHLQGFGYLLFNLDQLIMFCGSNQNRSRKRDRLHDRNRFCHLKEEFGLKKGDIGRHKVTMRRWMITPISFLSSGVSTKTYFKTRGASLSSPGVWFWTNAIQSNTLGGRANYSHNLLRGLSLQEESKAYN